MTEIPNRKRIGRVKKGEVLNPKGRPKGALSESTKILLALKEKAVLDSDKVYSALLRQVLEGDLRAIELWYRWFGTLPARHKYEMIQLKDLGSPNTTHKEKLKILEEALMGCKEYTFTELLDVFKVISNHRLNETLAENGAVMRLSVEESREQLRLVEEALEKSQQLIKEEEKK